MKKRIISLLLTVPFIIMIILYGFSQTVSLLVELKAEYIEIAYSAEQDFEVASLGDSITLEANAYPLNASNRTLIWKTEGITSFNGTFDDKLDPIASINEDSGVLTVKKEGTVLIKVSTEDGAVSTSFKAVLVVSGDKAKYISVNTVDTAETSLSDKRYFGRYDLKNGSAVNAEEKLTVKVLPSGAEQTFSANVSDENILSLSQNESSSSGYLGFSVISDGICTIGFVSDGAEASFEVEVVSDGLNVKTYDDLCYATGKNHPYAVVLRGNLESSENVGIRSNSELYGREKNGEIVCEYSSFESTYDTHFYDLKGGSYEGRDKTLLVGTVFYKNVYGNGYTINAHELTFPSEKQAGTGIAMLSATDLFRGPLYFVEALGCACYGQDNTGFMVSGDNITVDNIVLKNCNNVENLSDLDYVGTVLEIDGDGVTVKNSRIMNGRTCVRSFSNKDFSINGCLLSYAREFILKVGSNSFKKAKDESSLLAALPLTEEYCDSTVNVCDTFFYTSGAFSVGVDTHFAGSYLYDFSGAGISGLAATSYRTELSLSGDVRFYDWKRVDLLDSSTLIKLSDNYKDLFNIASAIENFYNQNKSSRLLLEKDGYKYVHGGIAFYGGGLNQSTIDIGELKNYYAFLSCFSFSLGDSGLGLSDVSSKILTGAAGSAPFRFYLYDPEYDLITVGSSPDIAKLREIIDA